MNSKHSQAVDDLLYAGFCIACIYVVFSVLVLFVSGVGPKEGNYATADAVAASAFQLDSGKKYPFRYGKRIEGSSGYAEARGGLFSSYARVSLQPASALSVNYQYGRNSYILELPVSKIKFVQIKSGVSSIKLKISREPYKELDTSSKRLKFLVVPYFGFDSKPLEQTRWFKNLKAEGQLGTFVQEYFKSATIRLNPKDYSKILAG